MRTGTIEVSDAAPSSLSPRSLSSSDVQVLLQEAHAAARRLVRCLHLPAHDCEDICQDLLVDLIARLKWFNPSRSSLGAFAGAVMRHRASKLAQRISRQRARFIRASGDGGFPGRASNEHRSDTHEDAGVAAVDPQCPDPISEIHRRLDLARALAALHPAELTICNALIDRTPTEMSRSGNGSRASLYRNVKEIRMQMLMSGVSAVA
jgi:DNA-directed RNA polymerase specialized sigma24 family protein